MVIRGSRELEGRGGEQDHDPGFRVLPESGSRAKRVVADSGRGA